VIDNIGFLGGFLMGLAGGLHCAGLCGGIASTLLIASSGAGTTTGRVGAMMATQLGRVTTYILLGGLVGGISSVFSQLLKLADLQSFLRVMAAGVLIWSGLAVTALVPGFARLDRFVAAAAGAWGLRQTVRSSSPILCGMLWGLAPCGMVYGALLNAMLSGSTQSGAMLMAGFGIATIPPVAMSAFGMSTLAAYGRGESTAQGIRRLIGLTIAALGCLSFVEPAKDIAQLCM
jgi:sulfite exporter TauE/SafE